LLKACSLTSFIFVSSSVSSSSKSAEFLNVCSNVSVLLAANKKIQSNLQENQELEQTANKIAETIQVLKNERLFELVV
jgi:hypothetical protein